LNRHLLQEGLRATHVHGGRRKLNL
jgi:hypothetical protein